jgi:hypothetical protein
MNMALIKNVELWWVKCDPDAPVKSKDDDKPDYWEVQIRTTDKASALSWKKNNVNFKPLKKLIRDEDGEPILDEMGEKTREQVVNDEGKPYFSVSLRRKITKKDGGDMKPVKVVGNGFPLNPNTVGNMSIGNVSIFQYDYVFQGTEGVASMLTGIQLTKLLEYTPSDGDEFTEEKMETVPEANGETTPAADTAPKGKAKPKPKKTVEDEMDDEIPF